MRHRELLQRGMHLLGIDHNNLLAESLCLYMDELQKWNSKMNLVAKAPPEVILENHFLDSLALLRLFPSDVVNDSFMDIGTGAGFPGLVIKIALPGLPVTLVEPREKRGSFLRHIIRTLHLDSVQLLPIRLEVQNDKENMMQGSYSLVTSRAVADTASFLTIAAPYCRPGGKIVCMKGPQGSKEALQQMQEPARTDIRMKETFHYRLPFSGAERCLLVFEKADSP